MIAVVYGVARADAPLPNLVNRRSGLLEGRVTLRLVEGMAVVDGSNPETAMLDWGPVRLTVVVESFDILDDTDVRERLVARRTTRCLASERHIRCDARSAARVQSWRAGVRGLRCDGGWACRRASILLRGRARPPPGLGDDRARGRDDPGPARRTRTAHTSMERRLTAQPATRMETPPRWCSRAAHFAPRSLRYH
jgi:hypothetical protein